MFYVQQRSIGLICVKKLRKNIKTVQKIKETIRMLSTDDDVNHIVNSF